MTQEVLSHFRDAELQEIILPDDMPEYCISCFRCFTGTKGICTHSEYTMPIREKLLWADLIILTSPVYSYHVTGQMKVFLDHFANMWIVHRPESAMFRKQGIVISAASGPVYSQTLNEMKDSLDFWGVARTYKLGTALMNAEWSNVSDGIKSKVARKAKRIAAKVSKRNGKIRPYFRVRKWFFMSSMMQKYLKVNPVDVQYWHEQNWIGKHINSKNKKPWN